jgi:hypothetical protein
VFVVKFHIGRFSVFCENKAKPYTNLQISFCIRVGVSQKYNKKVVRIKAIMDVIEKLEVFLKTKDEKYLLTLKNYFIERLQIKSNEKGGWTGIWSGERKKLLTIDFITDCLAEVPGGFLDFLYLVDEFIDPISEIILHFLSESFVKQFEDSFFEELKYELDIGSDEALLAMANSLLDRIDKDDLTSISKELQLARSLLVNVNGSLLKVLMQATLSIHLKLLGTAEMQIQHALKILLKKLTTYNIQHAVVEKSSVKKNAKLAGKKGSEKRWALKSKVRDEAFRLRDEMKMNGKFKNNMQASKSLTDTLCEFAKEIGEPYTDQYTAQNGIYKWFREEMKNK